jgi:4-diphosphocytidyl-2-C-methyl-D-erythritol kinase
MKTVEIKAPAKVNTFLRVVGRRPDGYHELEMIMVPLTLADDLSLTLTPSGVELEVEGVSDPGMQGEGNLAYRAANALFQEAGVEGGVRIRLKKNIPVAAGLGGGSSDAAAVLRGLNRLLGLDWSASRLASIGGRLGADVPFFCYGGPAHVQGTGDQVEPLDGFPNVHFLLVNPGFSVSTPWVYKQWDLRLTPQSSGATVRPLFQVVSDVVDSLHNDLEAVTIPAYPEVAEIKKELLDRGATGALMSGSGPTVFGVFENGRARDEALAGMVKGKRLIFGAETCLT